MNNKLAIRGSHLPSAPTFVIEEKNLPSTRTEPSLPAIPISQLARQRQYQSSDEPQSGTDGEGKNILVWMGSAAISLILIWSIPRFGFWLGLLVTAGIIVAIIALFAFMINEIESGFSATRTAAAWADKAGIRLIRAIERFSAKKRKR